MPHVRSLVQLIAQSTALAKLNAQDPAYAVYLQEWVDALSPAERAAMTHYHQMIRTYMAAAPRPVPAASTMH